MSKENNIKFELSPKQFQAYDILIDHFTNEIVFGGGARGGKSYLGSFWIIAAATRMYPNSAWLIAREELKALKRTTMRTFFKVLSVLGMEKDKHYQFNAQDMVLTFVNGSVVFFAELKRVPSDPEFDRIGSYDLTGAWIDEAQEICKDAKDALQFRFTTMTGNGWETIPKTLYTCNPSKNWIYQDFWKPLICEKKKVEGKKFIVSLYTDNPYIDHKKYKKNVLKTNNKAKIERLLRGNFQYDDDPSKLIDYDAILDLFTNKVDGDTGYISCDVARFGEDRTVIVRWKGLQAKEILCFDKTSIPEIRDKLKTICEKYNIRRSNVIVDEDGVGGGVVDVFSGCKGFINNSKCLQVSKKKIVNYANLKTQCYFEFARLINDGKIGIEGITTSDKEKLIEELEQIKQKDIDKDNKISLVGKEIIKENIGRSPDISDALMMRMYYELKPKRNLKPYFV